MKLKVGHFYRTSKESTTPGVLSKAHDHSIVVFVYYKKQDGKFLAVSSGDFMWYQKYIESYNEDGTCNYIDKKLHYTTHNLVKEVSQKYFIDRVFHKETLVARIRSLFN